MPARHRTPVRLLREPVFVLSAVRSGSTLLRAVLDGHSRLFAPHELTTEPERVVRRICAFLGVGWEPGMLCYRDREFKPGIGDWGPRIHAGRPLPAPRPPDDIPEPLLDACRTWRYA